MKEDRESPCDQRHNRILCDKSDNDLFGSGKYHFKISDMNSQSHAEHGNAEKDRSIVCSPCKSITPEEGNDRKADNNHSDIFGKNRADP